MLPPGRSTTVLLALSALCALVSGAGESSFEAMGPIECSEQITRLSARLEASEAAHASTLEALQSTLARHEAHLGVLLAELEGRRSFDKSTQSNEASSVTSSLIRTLLSSAGWEVSDTRVDSKSVVTRSVRANEANVTNVHVHNLYWRGRLWDPDFSFPTRAPTHAPTPGPSTAWHFPGDDTIHFFWVRNMVLPTPEWTIEMWVYPMELAPTTKHLLGFANELAFNCPMIRFGFTTKDVWHHLVITYSGAVLSVYDDGVLVNDYIYPEDVTCGTYTGGSFTIGQDQDSYEGGLDASQAPNMYLDTVAVYSGAWTAAYATSTATVTCVNTFDPYLYSLYVPDGSSSVADAMGNNPPATVTQMSALSTLDGVVGKC